MTKKTLPPGIRWELAMLHLRAALEAAPVMKTGHSDHAKDAATATYVHSVDEMVDHLRELWQNGSLRDVADFLHATAEAAAAEDQPSAAVAIPEKGDRGVNGFAASWLKSRFGRYAGLIAGVRK